MIRVVETERKNQEELENADVVFVKYLFRFVYKVIAK